MIEGPNTSPSRYGKGVGRLLLNRYVRGYTRLVGLQGRHPGSSLRALHKVVNAFDNVAAQRSVQQSLKFALALVVGQDEHADREPLPIIRWVRPRGTAIRQGRRHRQVRILETPLNALESTVGRTVGITDDAKALHIVEPGSTYQTTQIHVQVGPPFIALNNDAVCGKLRAVCGELRNEPVKETLVGFSFHKQELLRTQGLRSWKSALATRSSVVTTVAQRISNPFAIAPSIASGSSVTQRVVLSSSTSRRCMAKSFLSMASLAARRHS